MSNVKVKGEREGKKKKETGQAFTSRDPSAIFGDENDVLRLSLSHETDLLGSLD
jgi:hypothetical protein